MNMIYYNKLNILSYQIEKGYLLSTAFSFLPTQKKIKIKNEDTCMVCTIAVYIEKPLIHICTNVSGGGREGGVLAL